MSEQRSRPWQNPTPLVSYQPNWAGQFDTFRGWVSHATRALTGDNPTNSINQELPAICIDAKGRRCNCGGDFMRARDENAFPVRYFWDFEEAKDVRKQKFHSAEHSWSVRRSERVAARRAARGQVPPAAGAGPGTAAAQPAAGQVRAEGHGQQADPAAAEGQGPLSPTCGPDDCQQVGVCDGLNCLESGKVRPRSGKHFECVYPACDCAISFPEGHKPGPAQCPSPCNPYGENDEA